MKRRGVIPVVAMALMAVVATTALAAGSGVPAPSAPLSPAALAGARPDAVTVGQLHCPTTYGVPETPPPVPPTTAIAIPTVLRSAVVAYANDVVAIAAPPNWACKGAVGPDGSWTVTVSPASDRHAAITAQGADACYGCALDIAAARFPAAAKLDRALCGSACAPTKPAGEIAGSLAAIVVYFEDPPTASAPYRTRGVVVFQVDPSTNQPAALEATCALPSTSVYLCQPILAAFLTEFGIKAHW